MEFFNYLSAKKYKDECCCYCHCFYDVSASSIYFNESESYCVERYATEEERLEAFKKHFYDFSAKYSAKELFTWHHALTGSCKQGRESFCKQHGIDLDEDMFTIYEFVKLTKDSYGGDIVKKLFL